MVREYFRNYLLNTCDTTLTLGRAPAVQFHGQHDEEDWSVTLANTGEESMTAHCGKLIQKYINPGEPFLLTYGDGLSNIDINESIRCHQKLEKICTVALAWRFGALALDDNVQIQTFNESRSSRKLMSTAVSWPATTGFSIT